jgi:hypothetical protein
MSNKTGVTYDRDKNLWVGKNSRKLNNNKELSQLDDETSSVASNDSLQSTISTDLVNSNETININVTEPTIDLSSSSNANPVSKHMKYNFSFRMINNFLNLRSNKLKFSQFHSKRNIYCFRIDKIIWI